MKQIEKGNRFRNRLGGYQNCHRVNGVTAKRGRLILALLARCLCDLPHKAVNSDFRTQLLLGS